MRDVLTTLLEVLAVAAVVYGVFLISLPAAFIVLGLLLAGASYRLTPRTGGKDSP